MTTPGRHSMEGRMSSMGKSCTSSVPASSFTPVGCTCNAASPNNHRHWVQPALRSEESHQPHVPLPLCPMPPSPSPFPPPPLLPCLNCANTGEIGTHHLPWGRAGQGRAGQEQGQGTLGWGRAEQGRAGQGRAGQGRAGPPGLQYKHCSTTALSTRHAAVQQECCTCMMRVSSKMLAAATVGAVNMMPQLSSGTTRSMPSPRRMTVVWDELGSLMKRKAWCGPP